MTRLVPTANPDLPGDLPDPWDAWINGDGPFEDLSPEDQVRASKILAES